MPWHRQRATLLLLLGKLIWDHHTRPKKRNKEEDTAMRMLLVVQVTLRIFATCMRSECPLAFSSASCDYFYGMIIPIIIIRVFWHHVWAFREYVSIMRIFSSSSSAKEHHQQQWHKDWHKVFQDDWDFSSSPHRTHQSKIAWWWWWNGGVVAEGDDDGFIYFITSNLAPAG